MPSIFFDMEGFYLEIYIIYEQLTKIPDTVCIRDYFSL